MAAQERLLEVENLKKFFPVRKGIIKRVVGHVKAVDDINMFIKEGETLAWWERAGAARQPRHGPYCG